MSFIGSKCKYFKDVGNIYKFSKFTRSFFDLKSTTYVKSTYLTSKKSEFKEIISKKVEYKSFEQVEIKQTTKTEHQDVVSQSVKTETIEVKKEEHHQYKPEHPFTVKVLFISQPPYQLSDVETILQELSPKSNIILEKQYNPLKYGFIVTFDTLEDATSFSVTYYGHKGTNYYIMAYLHAPLFSITKENIAKLPLLTDVRAKYYYVIENISRIDEMMIKLLKNKKIEELTPEERTFGLDTESKPNFIPGQSRNPICLLQIASADTVVVFNLRKIIKNSQKLPISLVEFLESNDLKFVGMNVKGDANQLNSDYLINCKKAYNIEDIPLHSRCFPKGLKPLASLFLGIRVSSKATLTNWEKDYLTRSELMYAANDACLSRELYLKLLSIPYDSVIKTNVI